MSYGMSDGDKDRWIAVLGIVLGFILCMRVASCAEKSHIPMSSPVEDVR